MNVKDVIISSRSKGNQYNQRDQIAQQTATVTTRYGRVTVGPTYSYLPTDALLEVMNCLKGLESINVLRTCKHFLAMSYTRCFWKILCKQQSAYLQNDPFESLIQSQTQSYEKREFAYHKLYQLRLRVREPWIEKLLVGAQWFQPAYRRLKSVAALPNGNIILAYENTFESDTAGSLWSPVGEHITELGDRSPFKTIEILPDGSFVTLADTEVCVWSSTGRKLATHAFPWNSVGCIAALPNRTIVMGCADGNVRIWSHNLDLVVTFGGHTRWVGRIAVRPDGGFVTGSSDCTAIIWSADGDRVATLTGDTTLLNEDFSIPEWERNLWPRPVRSHIAVLTNGNIVTWWTRAEAELPAGRIYRWGPDGRKPREGRIWSPDGRWIGILPYSSFVDCIAASPNGGLVVARGDQSDFYLFPGKSIRCTKVTKIHTESITCIGVSPKDGRVVTASDDRIMRIWSPQGELITTFKKQESRVNWVTWLSNGDILAGYNDATARVWTMDVKLLLQDDRGHSSCFLSIFTKNTRLLSGCAIS